MKTSRAVHDLWLHGSPRHKAMLVHQHMFGKFVGAKRVADIGLWQAWGADNGAFTGFDQDRFMKNFRILLPFQSACKFVVVPDVPFHWEPTLAKFADWSPTVRRLGFPLALAVQDGATVENVPWSEFDALFIGGSTEWKRQQWRQVDNDLPLFSGKPYTMERPTVVADLIAEAKVRGKWVHIGRSANAPAQLWYAYRLGADSVDGTGEKYEPAVKFKWIAQTMWEIHRDKERRNTSLGATWQQEVSGTTQERTSVQDAPVGSSSSVLLDTSGSDTRSKAIVVSTQEG